MVLCGEHCDVVSILRVLSLLTSAYLAGRCSKDRVIPSVNTSSHDGRGKVV